ncbi:MAG: hypothetical protein R2777_04985 [Chitinophagales bacterium]
MKFLALSLVYEVLIVSIAKHTHSSIFHSLKAEISALPFLLVVTLKLGV